MNIFARITEPSTHAGIAVVSQVLKTFAPPWAAVFDALTMLCGALAVAIPEKKPAS